jgi:hypothetical protein
MPLANAGRLLPKQQTAITGRGILVIKHDAPVLHLLPYITIVRTAEHRGGAGQGCLQIEPS